METFVCRYTGNQKATEIIGKPTLYVDPYQKFIRKRMIHKKSYELSASEPHIIPKKAAIQIKKKEAIFHSNYYFCWPVMFQTNLAFLDAATQFSY